MYALGIVDPRMPWRYADLSRRLTRQFGKMRGLHRCHKLFSEIVQLEAQGKSAHAWALAIQCCKCLHQVALDGGDWSNADLLIPIAEGLDTGKFGGTERELAAVHSYRKAVKELQRNHRGANQQHQEEQEPIEEALEEEPQEGDAAPRGGRARGGRRGRGGR